MAFVTEDGTGKADANSYVTLVEADGYFSDRGIAAWTGADAVKQAALVKATDYIEGRFSHRFIGNKKTTTQALSWPRSDTDEGIPVGLRRACCEYALRALSAALAPDISVDASGMTLTATKKKIGPIETEYSMPQTGLGATPMLFRPYPAADMLLRGLVYASSLVIR